MYTGNPPRPRCDALAALGAASANRRIRPQWASMPALRRMQFAPTSRMVMDDRGVRRVYTARRGDFVAQSL